MGVRMTTHGAAPKRTIVQLTSDSLDVWHFAALEPNLLFTCVCTGAVVLAILAGVSLDHALRHCAVL